MTARTWKYFDTHLPFLFRFTLRHARFAGVFAHFLEFKFVMLCLPWLPQTYCFVASIKKTGGSFQYACLAMAHGKKRMD